MESLLSHSFDYLSSASPQKSFQWNVAMRLIGCLERLLGKGSNGTNDLLIVQTLDLIQGVLLLHPPSRDLFAREIHMTLFLDLLDPLLCPAIQSSTLLALVTSLLDSPLNARTFEACDGLLVVTSLFKSRTTSREVRLKLVEFLYFYLMPETAPKRSPSSDSSPSTPADVLGGRKKELVAAFDRNRRRETAMLGRYMSNVQDLVEDLAEGGGLFGGKGK
ncbi:hypothetical protein DV735_g1908, partial [Chaetothyriales sp. CBS 134920]